MMDCGLDVDADHVLAQYLPHLCQFILEEEAFLQFEVIYFRQQPFFLAYSTIVSRYV